MHRGRVLRRWWVAVICGAAVGCASGTTTTQVTDRRPGEPAVVEDAAWEAALTEQCSALTEEHADLAAGEPTDLEGARRHAAAVAAFTADYAAAFDAVDHPAGDPAAGHAARQLATRLADAGQQLHEAAQDADADAAERAVQRLTRLGVAIDDSLRTWDVEPCRGFGGVPVTTP